MDFVDWEPIYNSIIKDFGFDRTKDEEAATFLDGLLAARDPKAGLTTLEDLTALVSGKEVHIFGRGPSLVEDIAFILAKGRPKGVLIAADGASSRLMENGLVPDVIVTDLDGRVEDQLELNKNGSIIIVHAHGDNVPALREWVPRFKRRVAGTCQCRPVGRLLNFGGFTDGDRSAYMAQALGASMVVLAGFDHGAGRDESMEVISKRKMRKLDWAFVLLGLLDGRRLRFLRDPEDGMDGISGGTLRQV